MRKYILFLFFSIYSNAQIDTLKINYPKIDPVINKIDSLNTEKLFEKTKNWIGEYYKNPKIVLKSEIKNESLRIDGLDNFSFKWMGVQTYDFTYTLTIEFKEGRYKTEFSNIILFNTHFAPDFFYDKKGKRKTQKVNIEMCDSFMNRLNEINKSLYLYLSQKKKDW